MSYRILLKFEAIEVLNKEQLKKYYYSSKFKVEFPRGFNLNMKCPICQDNVFRNEAESLVMCPNCKTFYHRTCVNDLLLLPDNQNLRCLVCNKVFLKDLLK